MSRTSACLSLLVASVQAHGVMTLPMSRALFDATRDGAKQADFDGLQYAGMCVGGSCEWYTQSTTTGVPTTNCNATFRTMGVTCDSKAPIDYPCTDGDAAPWCAPGRAPVKSPCGVFSGGFKEQGRDMLDLDAAPAPTWVLGNDADIAWAITANHGGGYSYRLCPADGDLSEECFQANHLDFATSTTRVVDPDGNTVSQFPATRLSVGTWPEGSTWTRNPFPQEDDLGPTIPGLADQKGRGPFKFNLVDTVKIPSELPPGHYVLSLRWDAEQTKQVWSHCSDVMLAAAPASPAVSAPSAPSPPSDSGVCRGASIGLGVADCAAWVSLYDALDGPSWPAEWKQGCLDLRTDPCGCAGGWEMSIRCTAVRDLAHITELYLLSDTLSGEIPASISQFSHLVSLSLVGTKIRGSLPMGMGSIKGLAKIWLDHNPMLGGEIPQDWTNLPLDVLEMHYSNFTGTLPALDYANIPDCTLNGHRFKCPLPPGAESCGAVCL